MFKLLQHLSIEIGIKLRNLSAKKTESFIVFEKAHRIVKFYGAVSCFGPELIDMEYEAIEIFLKKHNVSARSVEDIAYVSYIAQNQDLCLINRKHFENAITILNELEVDTEETEYQTPGTIVNGIMLLMSLYGAKNFPIESDALDFVIESFKNFGLTQPPLLIADVPKIVEKMDTTDESLITQALQIDIDKLDEINYNILPARIANYLLINKPIIGLVKETFHSIMQETNVK